jgi:membrane associated rhomboid family serine protease
MFTCPNCGSTLTRKQGKVGLIWSCDSCGGRAVSIALLRRLIGNERVSAIWSRAINAAEKGSRPCPICSRGMTEESIGIAGQMLKLGICTRCEFTWFDTPQYESIPPPPPKPRDSGEVDEKGLPQAAREALALYKVQQMAKQEQEGDPEPDATWKTVPAVLGLPVEMDSDPLTRLPLATLSLSLLIAAVSIWGFFDLENITQKFGLIPNLAWRYGGLTFLTSFFLHGGIFHLVSNLYFLIIFGVHVENYLGSRRWLLLVFLSAIVGDFLHIAADPRGDIPCIGASGGISGLIAFYAFKFPHAKLGILFRYYYVYFKWLQFPAWCAFLFWLGLQGVGAFQQVSGFSNVSSLAHLGGTAVGVALWFFWRKIELESAAATAGSTA